MFYSDFTNIHAHVYSITQQMIFENSRIDKKIYHNDITPENLPAAAGEPPRRSGFALGGFSRFSGGHALRHSNARCFAAPRFVTASIVFLILLKHSLIPRQRNGKVKSAVPALPAAAGEPPRCRSGTFYFSPFRCHGSIKYRSSTFCSLMYARRSPPSAQVRMRINFGSSRAKVEQQMLRE